MMVGLLNFTGAYFSYDGSGSGSGDIVVVKVVKAVMVCLF